MIIMIYNSDWINIGTGGEIVAGMIGYDSSYYIAAMLVCIIWALWVL